MIIHNTRLLLSPQSPIRCPTPPATPPALPPATSATRRSAAMAASIAVLYASADAAGRIPQCRGQLMTSERTLHQLHSTPRSSALVSAPITCLAAYPAYLACISPVLRAPSPAPLRIPCIPSRITSPSGPLYSPRPYLPCHPPYHPPAYHPRGTGTAPSGSPSSGEEGNQQTRQNKLPPP